MECMGCQLPRSLSGASRAFVWPPQGHTAHKIALYLQERGYGFENRLRDNCVVVDVPDLQRFVLGLNGLLGEVERQNTRILILDEGEPTLRHFGQVATVSEISLQLRGSWVVRLIEDGRLHMHAQPILQMNDRVIYGHEFLMRGEDEEGQPLGPAAIFDAARDPRILFNLDRAARIKAVEAAALSGVAGAIFINFMPGSVYDPNVCLRTTVNAVIECGIDPKRVVFEIVETEKIQDFVHLRGIINFYRQTGFRIALDDFGSGYSNLEAYLALAPDFIKLDKSLTRDIATDAAKRDLIGSLVQRAGGQGICTIAEGIETEEMAGALTQLGVQYGQGYHFGRPHALIPSGA